MEILPSNYPTWKTRPHTSYTALFATLIDCKTAVCVEAHEVNGKSKQAKQIALHQAARQRGLTIDTKTYGEMIFIRLRPEGR